MRWNRKSKEANLAFSDIYKKWQESNRLNHSLFITYTGLFVSFVMIFADHLFITQNEWLFTKVRFMGLALMVTNLTILYFVLPRLESRLPPQVVRLVQGIFVGLAIYVYNFEYYYFIFATSHDKFSVYFIGLLLGVCFGAFMLHRFLYEQLVFHGFFILLNLGLLPSFKKEFGEVIYIIIIVHLVSAFVASYFRRDFLVNLNSRFNLLSAFIPKQLASHIVISDNAEEVEQIFKARNRYTVCLSCDWREYQNLIARHSPDFISSLIEDYYNRVFEALDRIDPQGQYYANWTADELFVIFFDLKDDEDNVDRRALEFAQELATQIFLRVRYDFSVDLKYDIGLASGNGYLGLQGPAKLKKTTITGFAAGVAKRLETEAKTIRKMNVSNPNPILLMDPHLYSASQSMSKYEGFLFQKIVSQVKDIQGKTFYMYQSNDIDVQKEAKQKAG
jgi:class 3 adenylate cyclase